MPTTPDAYSGDGEVSDAGLLLELLDAGRPAWYWRGACRTADPAVSWFPTRRDDGSAARAICAGCEVRGECLEYAMGDPTLDGIWAGTTPRQRAAMRREGKAA